MTQSEIEAAIDELDAWTLEAADILSRITDRLDTLTVRVADLHARISEFRVDQ